MNIVKHSKDSVLLEDKKIFNSNMYLQLRTSFSLVQKRIIHFIIRLLQNEMYKLNDDICKGLPIQRTIFGDVYFSIPVSVIDPNNSHGLVKNSIRKMMIPIDEVNRAENFILKGERINNVWRILVPERTYHFLTIVSKGVTPLSTIMYLSAKSVYTIRMYELCMQRRDLKRWHTTPEDLKDLLGTPKSYKYYGQFLQKALNPAKKEMDEMFEKKLSEIRFSIDEERSGRGNKVQLLIINIFTSEEKTRKHQTAQEAQFIQRELKRIMIDNVKEKGYKKKNQEFLERAYSTLVDRNLCGKFANRLEKLLQDHTIEYEQKGAVARWILQNDYNCL